MPEALAQKMTLFRESGRIYRTADELFAEVAWLQVLLGQGIVPESYHPMADLPAADQLDGFLADMKRFVAESAARLPTHEEYLSRNCRAEL